MSRLLAKTVLSTVALGLVAACTSLPEYARPTAESIDPSRYQAGDAIRYRELSRTDFRAASPPEQIAAHASEFGAYTCAIIRADTPEARISVVRDPASGGFVARLPDVEYYAEMDRGCSWWNPHGSSVPTEYVLQHEQIHFALVEIQARRLAQSARGLTGRGRSPQAAASDLQRSHDAAIQAARRGLVERNTRFDEETSDGYQPGRQRRWLSRVLAELGQGG